MIIVLLFFIILGLGFIIMYIFVKGGRYVKSILKEGLPWYKGKGRHILYLNKNKDFVLDYRLFGAGNKLLINNDEYIAEGHGHTILDISTIDFTNKSTIHRLNRQPLYFFSEGAPTDVLVQSRDYDQDVYKIKEIIANLKKTRIRDVLSEVIQQNNKIYLLLQKLSDSFKYLPQANEVVITLLNIGHPDNYDSPKGSTDLITEYIHGFTILKNILTKKTHTFINFNEFFTTTNLTRIFNRWFKEAAQLERLKLAHEDDKVSPITKYGSVILIIALVLIGFMVYNQGKSITNLQAGISGLNASISKLTPDTNNIFNNLNSQQRLEILNQLQDNPLVSIDYNSGN